MSDYGYGWDGLTFDAMRKKMEQGWQGATPCGAGSELHAAACAIRALHSAIALLTCVRARVANVGAGDLGWWPSDVEADHYDLVVRHPNVKQFDCTAEVLPAYDLIVCRFVLNHLSAKLAAQALHNFKLSCSRYLLVTTWATQDDYFERYGFTWPPQPVASYPEYRDDIKINLYKISELRGWLK